MIIKLTDMLDLGLLKERGSKSVPQNVIDSITERFAILEDAFQTKYLRNDYGYTSFYIITEQESDRESIVDEILNFFHLEKAMYEYSDIVGEKASNTQPYRETMWLLGNDTSVVVYQALDRKELGE
jgi:hypothetical protein